MVSGPGCWPGVLFLVLFPLLPLSLSPAVDLCVRLGSCLLFPLCVCLVPRVSRLILILTCSDHVQFGPPVDLCVRELSPPFSNVNRRLWRAW